MKHEKIENLDIHAANVEPFNTCRVRCKSDQTEIGFRESSESAGVTLTIPQQAVIGAVISDITLSGRWNV